MAIGPSELLSILIVPLLLYAILLATAMFLIRYGIRYAQRQRPEPERPPQVRR